MMIKVYSAFQSFFHNQDNSEQRLGGKMNKRKKKDRGLPLKYFTTKGIQHNTTVPNNLLKISMSSKHK